MEKELIEGSREGREEGMGGEDEGETSVRLKHQLIKFKNDMCIKKEVPKVRHKASLFSVFHIFPVLLVR